MRVFRLLFSLFFRHLSFVPGLLSTVFFLLAIDSVIFFLYD